MRSFRLLFCSVVSFFLFSQPLSAAKDLPARECSVRIAAGSALISDPLWKKEIANLIQIVNLTFENQGIRLKLSGYTSWDPENPSQEIHSLIENLKSSLPISQNEMMIGFVKTDMKRLDRDDIHIMGLAQTFSGYVVMREPVGGMPFQLKKRVALHEIGHLFGAVHILKSGAIMHPFGEGVSEVMFDPDNQQAIRACRDVNFKQGRDSLSENTIKKLIRIYERLLSQNARQDFYFDLGHLYHKSGNISKAIETWEEGLRYDPRDPRLHYQLGIQYFEKGDMSRARSSLESAAPHFTHKSETANRAASLNALGAIYYRLGLMEPAIRSLQEAIQLTPQDGQLYGNLGGAYLQLGNMEMAVKNLEKARQLSPAIPEVLMNLGLVALKQEKNDEAVDYLTRALKGSGGRDVETQSRMHALLGRAYFQKKQTLMAMEEFSKAESLDPKNEDVAISFAVTFMSQGKPELAVERLEPLKDGKRQDPYFCGLIAEAYLGSGKADKALEWAQQGLRSGHGQFEGRFRILAGQIYSNQENWDKAIDEFRYAIARDWRDKDAHKLLAQAYQRKGTSDDEIIRELRFASDIDPKDTEVRYFLGLFYQKQGKRDDARREYEKVLAQDPNNAQARQALEKL